MKNALWSLLGLCLILSACESEEDPSTEVAPVGEAELSELASGEAIYQVRGDINERHEGTAIFEQTRDDEIIEDGFRDVYLLTITAGERSEFLEIVMPFSILPGPESLVEAPYEIRPYGASSDPQSLYFQGIISSSAFTNPDLFMIDNWTEDGSYLYITSVAEDEVQGYALVRDIEANGNEFVYEAAFKATPGTIFN